MKKRCEAQGKWKTVVNFTSDNFGSDPFDSRKNERIYRKTSISRLGVRRYVGVEKGVWEINRYFSFSI